MRENALRYAAILLAVCGLYVAVGTGLPQMLERNSGQAIAKDLPAYGTADDIAFGKTLWEHLRRAQLVGNDRLTARPTKGERPHGSVQQIIAGTISVEGRRSRVVVKANHRGKGVSQEGVFEDPKRFLTGYAVMAKREPGYDPAHADWYWAVFNPNGSLRKFKGKAIAGRVDTGADNGCIGCHKKYGGKDYEMLDTAVALLRTHTTPAPPQSSPIRSAAMKRLLRDLDLAELAHLLLARLLLVEQLALAGDVAAVAFRDDVLAQRGDRFAGDDACRRSRPGSGS